MVIKKCSLCNGWVKRLHCMIFICAFTQKNISDILIYEDYI